VNPTNGRIVIAEFVNKIFCGHNLRKRLDAFLSITIQLIKVAFNVSLDNIMLNGGAFDVRIAVGFVNVLGSNHDKCSFKKIIIFTTYWYVIIYIIT
jgi:hypothetical protein